MSLVFLRQRIKSSTLLSDELKDKLLTLKSYPSELTQYLETVFNNEDSLLDQLTTSFNSIVIKYIQYLEIIDKNKENQAIQIIETKLQHI